ncbi:MAG: RNA polymerase sigma factor, partial [Oscillospiraceae bacterium]
MSDIEKYVEKAIAGDQEAFAKLYELSKRQVYFTCLKLLKNEHDAQDITQEVYITVLKKLSILTDRSSFQPWVNRIAVNK